MLTRHFFLTNRIASGSDDGKVIIWDYVTGEKVMVLEGHNLAITCLMLLDRNRLVSGSADKTIRVINSFFTWESAIY